ncbi:MAG TPA: DUF5985 family protein [Thermoanaerobaculia bacterium]|jgi:hypothetical protein|nr:DUF5985 family protein [Thermoanaerobaculia bacterium]
MSDILSGILITGDAVAGLFFLRFWVTSRDRLFAMFAVAFWLLGIQRVLLAVTRTFVEDQAMFYTLRLLAFVIIIVAIIDKNRR